MLLFFTFFIFISCEKKTNDLIIEKGKSDNQILIGLQKGLKGDTLSFNNSASDCMLHRKNEYLYFYSLRMINKYDYPKAYFYAYFSIISSDKQRGVVPLDVKTKNLAHYYLLKSYELGCKDGEFTIKDIFGDNIPHSEEFMKKNISITKQ